MQLYTNVGTGTVYKCMSLIVGWNKFFGDLTRVKGAVIFEEDYRYRYQQVPPSTLFSGFFLSLLFHQVPVLVFVLCAVTLITGNVFSKIRRRLPLKNKFLTMQIITYFYSKAPGTYVIDATI